VLGGELRALYDRPQLQPRRLGMARMEADEGCEAAIRGGNDALLADDIGERRAALTRVFTAQTAAKFAAAPQFLPTFKSWYPRIIVSRGLAFDVERAVCSSHLARKRRSIPLVRSASDQAMTASLLKGMT
jgi:hypothetical protein